MKNYVIAIDLGGTNIRAAAVMESGEMPERVKVKTLVTDGYGAVLQRVIDAMESVSEKMGRQPKAVGLASPGAIDFKKGVITKSPNFPDWNNIPFGKDVEARLGVPVALENDGNAAAIGEGWTGAAAGWDSFLMITLGTGIGGGLVLDCGVWRGSSGMAGEIGHVIIHPQGRLCGCGGRGCVEAYASANGTARTARERIDEANARWLRDAVNGEYDRIDTEILASGAGMGDRFCVDILSDSGRDLGVMIGTVAVILDVPRFVIGGGMSGAYKFIERSMRQSAIESAFTLTEEKLLTRQAVLGDDAGILGAAKLALELI